MLHKPARQNQPLDFKSLPLNQRPHHHRTERFAQQPSTRDSFLGQCLLHVHCIVLNGPGERPRISHFNESHPITQRPSETADQRPITMQTRQINQRRTRSISPDAQLNLFRLTHFGKYNIILHLGIHRYFCCEASVFSIGDKSGVEPLVAPLSRSEAGCSGLSFLFQRQSTNTTAVTQTANCERNLSMGTEPLPGKSKAANRVLRSRGKGAVATTRPLSVTA